jgi:hypothetical protein
MKKMAFPRFFFLSNDEVLEVSSRSRSRSLVGRDPPDRWRHLALHQLTIYWLRQSTAQAT